MIILCIVLSICCYKVYCRHDNYKPQGDDDDDDDDDDNDNDDDDA